MSRFAPMRLPGFGSLLVVILASGSAQATPIPVPGLGGVTVEVQTDTDQQLTVRFEGGAILADANSSGSIATGTSWQISVTSIALAETDTFGASPDSVTIVGAITHNAGTTPDVLHERAGTTVNFTAFLHGIGGDIVRVNGFYLTCCVDGLLFKFVDHDGHRDKYTFEGIETAPAHGEIESWSLDIDVLHESIPVPEPATAMLLAIGVIAFAYLGRKRQAGCRAGRQQDACSSRPSLCFLLRGEAAPRRPHYGNVRRCADSRRSTRTRFFHVA
jgi:hypothetical protein